MTSLSTYQHWLKQQRFRGLLWLAGDKSWCESLLKKLRPLLNRDIKSPAEVLIGRNEFAGLTPLEPHQYQQLLGQQFNLGVINAFDGFNPNRFGLVSGAITAGGWLVLISPALADWAHYNDPEYDALISPPLTKSAINPRFLPRMVREFSDEASIVSVFQGQGEEAVWQIPNLPAAAEATAIEDFPAQYANAEQYQVVQTAEQYLAKKRATIVLHADRGRGKSSSLGLLIAAHQAQMDQPLKVFLTAVQESAVVSVVERLTALYPNGKWAHGAFVAHKLEVQFRSVHELLHEPDTSTLLMIDEAAAVPIDHLTTLSERFDRVVFSTTEHGYEGNGRGFSLRFLPHLVEQKRTPKLLSLKAPIRWQSGDPLEAITRHILLLDAEPAVVKSAMREAVPVIQRIDQSHLQDETLLRELYGLLVIAHYRTSPGDLRMLLDAPNLEVWLARINGSIVGAALISKEGEIPEELANAVWRGERRPKGQLLPQTLIAHEGWHEIASWRCLRVMRIAVHPRLQHAGIGSKLLAKIVEQAQTDHYDYVGASFTAHASVLGFWLKNSWMPLRVGDQLDTVSAGHACVAVKALSDRAVPWFRRARRDYAQRLRYRINGTLKDLEPKLLQPLLSLCPAPRVTSDDQTLLGGFADALRPLESVLPAFDRLLLRAMQNGAVTQLELHEQQMLIEMVWQQKPQSSVMTEGRKGQVKRLRQLCHLLLIATRKAELNHD